MSKFLSVGAAAKALGVSTRTLRRWDAAGRLVPIRTEGGQRRYDLTALRPGRLHGATVPLRTVAYTRVSSHDQRADLERPVLTHLERLPRFGAELVFALCEARNVEVVIINQVRTRRSRKTSQATCSRSSPSFRRGCTAAAAIGTRN